MKHESSVFDLSYAEELQLVQDLWDDLSANPESVPVPQWQKDLLDRRKADFQQDQTGVMWVEAKDRIRRRYAR